MEVTNIHMNKKEYLTPIIEVITIKSNEIIVTSDIQENPELEGKVEDWDEET